MSFFDALLPFDTAVLDFIQTHLKCEFLDPIMLIITYLGEKGALFLAAGIVMLFFRKTRTTGILVLASIALAFVVGELGLKTLIARPRPFTVRPDIVLSIDIPSGTSFPSGHSSSVFAGTTVLLARDKRFGIPALVVALLVVFSRLYYYVHYPSDIIAGMLLGILSAVVLMIVFRKTGLERRIDSIGSKKKQAL